MQIFHTFNKGLDECKGYPLAELSGALQNRLTHQYLSVPPEIVVWIEYTFDDNSWKENDFAKYLKESCW